MKLQYKFSNLLGTVYRRGDVVFAVDGNTVLCPVGNKISLFDLANNRSITLPVEARFDYVALALSPNGQILVAAQEDGEIHIIHIGFKKVIYKKRFKGKIQKICFSPCGGYFALAKQGTILVYSTPSCSRRVYDPFSRVKVFKHAYDDVLCMDWSYDSRLLSFGSQDISVHVCALPKLENFTRLSIGGHSEVVVGIFFKLKSYDLYTVTKNGHISVWVSSAQESDLVAKAEDDSEKSRAKEDDESGEECSKDEENEKDTDDKTTAMDNSRGHSYSRSSKTYLSQYLKSSMGSVTTTAFQKERSMLVVCFDSGDFLLLDLTESCSLLHSLNVSDKPISSVCVNRSGDWIGLGLEDSGELLVWEWQSETHVLKQKGHFNAMRVVAYSPDGSNIATGGEDGKVKIWSTQSSFCFLVFSEHTSEITGVTFTQSGKAIISSSFDGTVRAFDLIRYRNFRTLASPQATQFSCVAVDTSGELVAAGGQDVHEIFLWSLKTGKLLEILSGHTGPVVSIAFSPKLGCSMLLSTAWDRTIKVWDAITTTAARETVELLAEGTCVAFRGDGEQLAVSTMDGHITMFNVSTMRQEKAIEGRNDVGAGRTLADKVTSDTNLKSKYFDSVSYSPDGNYIVAAGKSRNVCVYSIEDELLLKKFVITENRSLDGMDKIVSRRHLTEDGTNLSLIEDRNLSSYGKRVPGSTKGASAEHAQKPEIRVTSLAFSNTGRNWAACTTEGLLIYSLDDDWLFDPLQLEENNTPEAVRRKLRREQYSTALMMAVRLNIRSLLMEVLEQIPFQSISVVVDSLSVLYVEALLKTIASLLESSRHFGFYTLWVASILTRHGSSLKQRAPHILSDLNELQKSLTTHNDNFGKLCSHNEYTLKYILCQGKLRSSKRIETPVRQNWSGSDSESDGDHGSQSAIFDD